MVTPLNVKSITPELLVHELLQDVGEFAELYVVAMSKTGGVNEYFSGTAKGLALASVILGSRAEIYSRAPRP